MSKLQIAIQNFLREKTILSLQKSTGVGAGTIIALRDGKSQKFSPRIIRKLYNFFSLQKDKEYYNYCLERRSNPDVVGNLLFYRRNALGLSVFRVSAETKISEKQILRLESGKNSFHNNSYALGVLLEYYNFSEEDKKVIIEHLEFTKKMTRIVKKYQ